MQLSSLEALGYALTWTVFCFVSLVMALRDPAIIREARAYVGYLLVPWKVTVFIPAAVFVTFAGQFAYDDTWDYVSGGGMSLLTYLTAPWAIGVSVLVVKGRRPVRHGIIAIAACLFSASWFYDAWLYLRDGEYSPMWLPNLLLSPYLYVAAGLLWNLEVDGGGRPTFGFVRRNWPEASPFRQLHPKLVIFALPPVLFAALVLLCSVRWRVF